LSKALKVTFVLALCLVASPPRGASAQQVQVGDNVNVLPVVNSGDPNDYLRGDLYGQRQGEPDIAFSSLNPDHAMAIYNDFRAVDVPNDATLPDFNSSAIARLWMGARTLLARVLGRPAPKPAAGPPVAALEAGIGMSLTYDGGMTWTGGFMPGLPFDDSPASSASPARLEGMSDPVLLSAPCGRFYAFYLAFTRGGQSKLMLARFQDLNNDELNHTIKFLGFTQIDSGQNDTNGHFLDKPSAGIIPTGASSCDAVTEHLVFVYTTFTGNGSGGKFQSRINFAKSVDGGRTFSISGIDKNFTQNQGTSVVVNPVTKQVVVFWRSFNSPHTIVMRKQQTNGNWANPVDILADDALTTLANFDQTTVSTSSVPVGTSLKDELAFRANAFPAAAFSPDGSTLIVAWHEKVDANGFPSPTGSPRIVWKYSKDGGTSWSERKAIAMDHPASPPGLGHFNLGALSAGPQLMPSVACAAGSPNRCLLTYYESRQPGLAANGWVGGYDRVLDLRGVLIDAPATPPNAAPVVNPSFQVSRYPYRPLLENETPQETLDYVEPICPPGGACYPALNYSGRPHTGGGTSPFMHDYTAVRPIVQWVKDKTSGAWRLAKDAADVPFAAGFGLTWADNRHVVEPTEGAAGGAAWQNYGNYGPAGLGGSCVNPGSRNQDVIFARVSLGLLLTAATNYKPFPGGSEPIEFPMTVWNNTGQDRQFELKVASGNGSFAKEPSLDGAYAFPLRDGGVTVFPYSSASIDVYAFDGNPVTVSVRECAVGTCTAVTNPLTGSITFNSPGAAPPAGAPSPTYRSADIVASPVPRNPVPRNPVPRNPVPRNPVPGDATVYDVITYSWNVTPTSQDDAGTYLALANIDRAYQNDYVFQVFVTKPTTRYAVNGCEPGNELQGSLVGHISEPGNPVPRNPVPRNPVPRNPVPRNAPLSDVLVQNTTFTLESNETASAPGPAGYSALSAASIGCDPVTGAGLIGECTLAAPRPANQATITVVAYQITPDPAVKFDPYGDQTGTPNPPSVVVADYWCTSAAEGCAFAQDGPDLAVPDPPSASVDPTRVRAGQTVTFPLAAVRIDNLGTQTAGPHRYGIYLSTATSASESALPRNSDGTIKENPNGPGVVTRLVDFGDLSEVLAGGSESIGSKVITVPTDIPLLNPDGTGTYYLYLYVDDRRRVNEIDEDNNIVQGGPITVDPAGYRMLGLYTPCSGLTCKKKTGSAFPLAFGLTFDGVTAVDSQSTPPRFKVYAPLSGGACRTTLPADGSGYLFLADPNDVSSGSSGWQYSTVAGTRPAFTWQYNFQGKNPTTGAILPTGCYSFALEVPATDQRVGSLLGPVTRLSITLTK
jgi:CARDB